MRFLWHRSALLAALAVLAGSGSACAVSAETTGTGGSAPTTPATAELRFEETATLTLSPGESATVGVVGEPVAAYQVAFALLGDSLDAWLDHAVAAADATTGRAMVEVHAPSQATTFHLRASVLDARGAPGASADRAVAVSERGFGAVEVSPIYAGPRAVTEWTATVVARASCKDLAPTLPQDPPGGLSATAPLGSNVIVDSAPIGPNLAVVVRAGHFAYGCAETALFTPGATEKLDVTILDKPLDLSNVSLDTTLRYDADADALAPIRDAGAALLVETFVPSGSKISSVILNSMALLVPPGAAMAFAEQRQNLGWDTVAANHFGAQSPDLRARLEHWVAAGLVQQGPSFDGVLASGAPPTFTLTRVGDIDAASAGAGPAAMLTWSGEPGDDVPMSSSLSWRPTRFAAAAAVGAAKLELASATSLADALATSADCNTLAASMGGFGACDVACLADLCAKAIAARLTAAADAGSTTTLTFKASPHATTGDDAAPISLEGHFLGETSGEGPSVMVVGDLAAKVK